MSGSFYLELEVSGSAIGEALSDMMPEQVVKVLSIADEHTQDWNLVHALHKWVLLRHREWAQEEVETEMETHDHCVTSPYYPDISSHSNPHKKCILR